MPPAPPNNRRWLFFDVGNVIFNDDPQGFHAYRFFHRHFEQQEPGFTFDHLLAEREREAAASPGWVLKRIGLRRLGAERYEELLQELRAELFEWFDENHLLNEGVREACERLRARYRLGIIANQPPECRRSLERRGLLSYFDVVGISEELDLHKPDLAFLRWALEQAGCAPEDAVMIGDRLDNDVAPAREIGMQAIQFRWGGSSQKNWRPTDPQAQRFLASLDRVPVFPAKPVNHTPNAVVSTWNALATAVEPLFAE